jgi:hypothetical protein
LRPVSLSIGWPLVLPATKNTPPGSKYRVPPAPVY